MLLQTIQRILTKNEFICSSFADDANSPFGNLSVVLNRDDKQRDRILHIQAIESPLADRQYFPNAPSLAARIQFVIALPFKTEDESLNQVASLLHFINHSSEMPGFELDELHGKVLYRYVWITDQKDIEEDLVLTLFGLIMLNLDLLSETIESVATGNKTFNDVLEEIVKIANAGTENV